MNVRAWGVLVTLFFLLVSGLPATAQGTLSANAGPDKTSTTGEAVSFDGSASTGSIASYNWDFGDGSTGSGPTTTHTYSAAGTFTVTLLLISTTGTTATDTATATIRTTDTSAPNITHTPVTSGTSNGAVSISANVTDNIGVQTVTLYYRKSTDASFNSTTMSCTGSGTSKACTGSVPASVTTGTAAHYYVHASDTRSPTANTVTWPANAPTGYVTVSLTDTEAPTIVHTAPTEATENASLTIEATITDNLAVTSATLNYRLAATGSFTSTTMTASGATYTASVTVATGTTEVDYYIEAADAAANTARSPTGAPGSPTVVGVTTLNAPAITHTATTNATAAADLSLTATVIAGSGRTVDDVVLRYRSAGSTGAFTEVAMTNATGSTSFAGTIPGAAITDRGVEYYIRATDTTGDGRNAPTGGASAPAVVTTPPATPSGVTATRGATGVTVTWTPATATESSTASSHKLYRSAYGTSFALLTTVTSGATYLDTAASAGLRYHYKVSAVDAYSTEGSLSTAGVTDQYGLLPAAPSITTTPGVLTVSVSWSSVANAAWYVLETSTDGSTWTQVQNVTGTTAAASGLTAGTAVQLRVRAYNTYAEAGGISAASTATPTAPATTTPAPAPAAVMTTPAATVPTATPVVSTPAANATTTPVTAPVDPGTVPDATTEVGTAASPVADAPSPPAEPVTDPTQGPESTATQVGGPRTPTPEVGPATPAPAQPLPPAEPQDAGQEKAPRSVPGLGVWSILAALGLLAVALRQRKR